MTHECVYETLCMYVYVNAQTFKGLTTHLVRMCTLIVGTQVYVYELCVDPKGLWL